MTTEVTAELNELRNQVRTLKRMLLGVFGLVVAGGLLAATSLQSVPDVIRAKQFEVVDDEKKPQVLISADGSGGVLQVNNKKGKPVVVIMTEESGGTFVLADNDENGVAMISASAHGGAIAIAGKNELPLLGMYSVAEGGVLTAQDKSGKTVVEIGTNGDGGALGLNKSGKRNVELGCDDDGGIVVISNKDGDPVALTYVDAAGDGKTMTANSKGQPTSESP